MQKIKISLLVFLVLAVFCVFAAGCEKQDTTQYSISVTYGTADKTTAVAGETVTLTADAAPAGKEFSHWVVDGNRIADDTFEMTSGNKSAVAVYKTTDSGFLTDYDITNVSVASDTSTETITYGTADFEPMVYTNGKKRGRGNVSARKNLYSY